jgi:hypothetical protein
VPAAEKPQTVAGRCCGNDWLNGSCPFGSAATEVCNYKYLKFINYFPITLDISTLFYLTIVPAKIDMICC